MGRGKNEQAQAGYADQVLQALITFDSHYTCFHIRAPLGTTRKHLGISKTIRILLLFLSECDLPRSDLMPTYILLCEGVAKVGVRMEPSIKGLSEQNPGL